MRAGKARFSGQYCRKPDNAGVEQANHQRKLIVMPGKHIAIDTHCFPRSVRVMGAQASAHALFSPPNLQAVHSGGQARRWHASWCACSWRGQSRVVLDCLAAVGSMAWLRSASDRPLAASFSAVPGTATLSSCRRAGGAGVLRVSGANSAVQRDPSVPCVRRESGAMFVWHLCVAPFRFETHGQVRGAATARVLCRHCAQRGSADLKPVSRQSSAGCSKT